MSIFEGELLAFFNQMSNMGLEWETSTSSIPGGSFIDNQLQTGAIQFHLLSIVFQLCFLTLNRLRSRETKNKYQMFVKVL
jgi:hypothetical protein